MQRNAGALASPVVQHVLSNGNTESNLWGLAEVIQEARQMEHTSWTKHLSSRAIVSPQSVDRVLHLLRMLASEAELNPRNLLFQTGLATVVVDHLTGSIVVAVRDTGPLVLSSQLKRTSFHGLAQTDLVELSEQLMAQLGGVLDKLMQGPYREKHLVVMGSGKSGAIAELLTLSLIERQNQELGWLSKGFLSGTVIKCFAFGAPPVMGVQADVPEKARAAISHWMLRGDAVASSSLHAADLLECVIYSREKSSLSEATELCSTEGRVTSIHHPLHVGRVLLLAQRHNEEHVLLMSPDHVAYVANHEMWHLQRENIRTAADYFEALGRVRVLEP